MILTVGNVKGGVGKTTLAINFAITLARRGREVLLIDGDEQQTAMQFTDLRSGVLEKAGYTCASLFGRNIQTQVKQLAKKYDDIVIDVGGRDTGSLRSALVVTDVVLMPVQPRSFDLWGTDLTISLVQEAREWNAPLVAICVVNGADAKGSDNLATAEELQKLGGVEVLPPYIVRRKAFPNAATAGKGIVEWDDEKAEAEFMAVFKMVLARWKR